MGKRAISNVWDLCDKDINLVKLFDLGFKILNDEKNVVLRDDIFNLVGAQVKFSTAITIVQSSGLACHSCATR